MGKYILKRLVHSLITLCIVITIVLLLLRKMPIEGYFNNSLLKNLFLRRVFQEVILRS